mmetsp:Transcript_35560/g.83064  ORF Transcript_35560/g.83064 Transcript_35560/m.83064 type:complete len:459 (-) Transcript_35560:48-1424(-)
MQVPATSSTAPAGKGKLQDLAAKYAVLYGIEPSEAQNATAKAEKRTKVSSAAASSGSKTQAVPASDSEAQEVQSTAVRVKVKSLPYHFFQSGIVQCPLTFIASLYPPMFFSELLEADISTFASAALGHSQGVASAACLTMGLRPSKVAVSLMRQGQLQQELVGLQHFQVDPETCRPQAASMVGLRGLPHGCLQRTCNLEPVALINDESNMVCSGELASSLLTRPQLKGLRNRTVRRNALPIAAPNHSRHLEPALFRLLADRCPYSVGLRKLDETAVQEGWLTPDAGDVVPVIPTSADVREVESARDTWRSVCSQQMVHTADYPLTALRSSWIAEQGDEEGTKGAVLDCGPLPSSIAGGLLKRSNPTSTAVVAAVTVDVESEVAGASGKAEQALVVPSVEVGLRKAFAKARVRYTDADFERMAARKDSAMGHRAIPLNAFSSRLHTRPRSDRATPMLRI